MLAIRSVLGKQMSSWGKFLTYRVFDRSKSDTFLTTNNGQYLDHVYEKWRKDPKSVHISWDHYFRSTEDYAASNAPTTPYIQQQTNPGQQNLNEPQAPTAPADSQNPNYIARVLDVNATIRAYQTRGHLIANTDPLGIQNPESSKLAGTPNLPPEIVIRQHLKTLSANEMEQEFPLGTITCLGGDRKHLKLREILTRLNTIYCGHIGLEYTYIHDNAVLEWLRYKFETPGAWELQAEHRKWIWMNIMRGVTFEYFLAKKYGPEKRFGLEGCESFVPSMMQIIESSSETGADTVVMAMAHRGRLNTLANICLKPMEQLFTQFNPISIEGFGSGDVKYHLGTYSLRKLERSGKNIQLVIIANSSHLEASDSVAVGRVRAEQVDKGDQNTGLKCVPILVHGDAAFSGQGMCYETINFTSLPDYTTGGVMHVVINNQIGFTTDPRYSRSSAHCTDVGRVVNAPIFHIHADDPDLVTYCSKVASEYRSIYHNDVVLDIVGYRRNGHNEMDEPMLTQPLMYKRIREHPNVLEIYSKKLISEGIITEAFAKEEREKYLAHCDSEFDKAQSVSSMQMKDWHDVPWVEFFEKQDPKNKIPPTGIEEDVIQTICNTVSTPPKGIEAHAQIYRVLGNRQKLTEARRIDWAMGECLAFGSLLKEGHAVRLSGEDVERGTFSHRLHIIHDQNKDKTSVNILQGIFPGQAQYCVSNSALSEAGVAGFELGYSSYNHNTLTIWEAQFGDFSNNCQVIIDCILSSGQTKWGRQVGLVFLLPHGMEGQGPEHSSMRIERYLQLCDDDYVHLPGQEPDAPGNETVEEIMTRQLYEINWIVCNFTTPANLVHALRRQILMPFRKPLIIATPKSLLRHPMAQSTFEEVGPGSEFKPIIPDTTAPSGEVEKIVLCTGKVYYDIFVERESKHLDKKIAVIRIEQICPFPYHLLNKEISKYSPKSIMWLQEEHKNQGSYHYVRDRIALALGLPVETIKYGGRPPSVSPATGSKKIYENEFKNMMQDAMSLP